MRKALLAFGLVACGTDVGQLPPDPQPDPTPPRATWYQDVAPIVSTHCMSCHQDGGIAPFALTAYEDARDNATRMLAQIDGGTMPPFDAREDADCTPRFGWKHDPRLSSTEIATIHAWVEDGSAEGTVAPVALPATTNLANVTETLAPVQPFTAAGTKDQFICTVLDPRFAQLTWLTGMQVRPGNAKVVHHAVITEMFPGAAADAVIAAHPIGMPWDCSQEQQPGEIAITAWVPGNDPLQTPSELAVPVLANAKLVMQIHYHPAGTIGDPDTTSIDLQTSPVWPRKMYLVTAFGNATAAPQLLADPDDRDVTTPEFRIPANKADHVEHMQLTVPDLGTLTNVQLYSMQPHQHLIGTHVSGRITRPSARGGDPQTECLANGNWNFDWQRTYVYDAPIDQLPGVQAGDLIDVTCHWNNTLDNPFEQRALTDAGLGAPVDISLGEGNSTDEMCLEIIGISVDAPAQPVAMTVDQLPMQLLRNLQAR